MSQQQRKPDRRPIPVAILKFPSDRLAELPGASQASAVISRGAPGTERGKNSRHELEYLPWMRHFRVAYHPSDPEQTTKVVYVHETQVQCWYPMDEAPSRG